MLIRSSDKCYLNENVYEPKANISKVDSALSLSGYPVASAIRKRMISKIIINYLLTLINNNQLYVSCNLLLNYKIFKIRWNIIL